MSTQQQHLTGNKLMPGNEGVRVQYRDHIHTCAKCKTTRKGVSVQIYLGDKGSWKWTQLPPGWRVSLSTVGSTDIELCPGCFHGELVSLIGGERAMELQSLISQTAKQATCPMNIYCSRHGFHHGAEATELREGIEKLIKTGGVLISDPVHPQSLQNLLDDVDARDSLAYEETKDEDSE